MKTKRSLLTVLFLHLITPQVHSASIVNGSFESGFTNWVTTDLAIPYSALSVRSTGFSFYTTVAATDGTNVAYHGFDGGGPGTISISQDVGTIDLSSAMLTFDYRAGWNMTAGATLDRVFSVVLSPAGGGSAIATFEVLRAQAQTITDDTGALSASIDLSSYVGTNARISFESYIPEDFTGPAGMQLDNVRLIAVPEPSSIGLALSGVLAALTLRHRK